VGQSIYKLLINKKYLDVVKFGKLDLFKFHKSGWFNSIRLEDRFKNIINFLRI
jgi:hypothetical protein